ncbi:MAG TPA: periplasmic heavy metal sensor [Bryobacteraceae bacterium]|nr:periplasmic heavy metal sensor [Bryobacteraceae bacterium]
MIRRAICLLLLLAFCLFGQPPRSYYNWWDGPIANDLKLTEAQRKEIRGAIRQFRPRLMSARAALEQADDELEAVYDADHVDTQRAQAAIDKLAAARSELTLAFSELSLRLRIIVTPEQWHELQQRRPVKSTPPAKPKPAPAH